ncbi:choice-of-anchor L domain-containing protein [Bacillus sp. FJAT-53711]|uniref:Choice-of-anchor L domain-containing protein n=1 Tax=Bacillus yunxiaonensis TaxID=3127665 RepID=A0ABU8FWR0_9BACI
MRKRQSYFRYVLIICIVATLLLPLPPFYVKANGEEEKKEERTFQTMSVQEAGKDSNKDISVSTLDENLKAEQLAKQLVGDGAEVRSVKYTGANQAAGAFQAKQNIFGLNAGVILSTGNAKGIIGPNKFKSYTQINNQPGDSDVEKLFFPFFPSIKTYDASVLEFEFKPSKEKMKIQYVLASEEFSEFTDYNDVVGIFVNGKNISKVQNSTMPVAVSSIFSDRWYEKYYTSNINGVKNTEMDGISAVLNAESTVNVNEWNTIKLVIADGKDNGVDSNVLINSMTFENVKAPEIDSEVYFAGASIEDKGNDKVIFTAHIGRTNNIDKQDSVKWKLSLPKTNNNAEEIKNSGEIVFKKGESEQTVVMEVNKQDRDIQFVLHSPSEHTQLRGTNVHPVFIREIFVNPQPLQLKVGEEQTFQVIARYYDEKEVDITEKVEIEVHNSDIAKVSSTNKIIGQSAGRTLMKVSYGQIPHWIDVNVGEKKQIKDIELDKKEVSLYEGEYSHINVTAIYEDGDVTYPNYGVKLTSSDEKIVRVLYDLTFEAVSAGEATITVEYEGIKKEITVKVEKDDSKIKGIDSNIKYDRIRVGEPFEYYIYANYDNGRGQDVTSKAKVESLHPDIIEVDKQGHALIGKKKGKATLKITYKDFTEEVTVEVKERVKELVISKSQFELKEHATDTFTVTAKYESGEEEDVTNQAYASINDWQLASVSKAGEITAWKEGQTTLLVRYEEQEVRIPVYIHSSLKDIEVEPSEISLPINEKRRLQVIGIYEGDTKSSIQTEATFSSNNENVKVDKLGNIVAQKEGDAVITVSVGAFTKEVKVHVTNQLLELHASTSHISLKTNEIYDLKVTGVYEDGSIQDVTSGVTFKSSNSSVVTVDSSGKLTTLNQKGKAIITITKDGQTLNIPVEVTEKEMGLLLDVQGTNGQAVEHVSIVVEDAQKKMSKLVTDGSGTLLLKPQEGAYKVYAYKKGYKPVVVDVDVKKGEITKKKIILEPSQLFDGKMNVQQMTKEEIQKAGIDINDPANRYVYKFELYLKVENEDKKVDYVINGKGNILNGNSAIVIGGNQVYPVVIQGREEMPPAVGYMVVPGQVSWLKEFFKVELVIQNFADEPFELTNSNVSLQLPQGLSLAPIATQQRNDVYLGTIGGNEVKRAEWYIRGDQKGQYNLEALFSSTLYPFDEAVFANFKTVKPIEVSGEDGVKMHIKVEKKAHKGLPYLVKIGIENKSPNAIYDLHVELNKEGKKNYIYTPGTVLKRVVDVVKTGETQWFDYLLLPTIEGDLKIDESFIKKVGGNVNIETVLSTID